MWKLKSAILFKLFYLIGNIFHHFILPTIITSKSPLFFLSSLYLIFSMLIWIMKFFFVVLLVIIIFSRLDLKSFINSYSSLYFFNLIKNHFLELHPTIRLKSNLKVNMTSSTNNFPLFEILILLFVTLAIINLSGMTYNNWCLNTWATNTIILSFVIWLITFAFPIYNLIFTHPSSVINWFCNFFPAGTPLWLSLVIVPIEIISYCIRFMSMGLRIAGNLVAGHVIMGLLASLIVILSSMLNVSNINYVLIALVVFGALTFMEICVAFIQAYVLTLLTSTFLKEIESIH